VSNLTDIIAAAAAGCAPQADAALRLEHASLEELLPAAESLTLAGYGRVVTYSRKVFIPLTQLCRDVCHYCTFAQAPRAVP
jgi:FO synthase